MASRARHVQGARPVRRLQRLQGEIRGGGGPVSHRAVAGGAAGTARVQGALAQRQARGRVARVHGRAPEPAPSAVDGRPQAHREVGGEVEKESVARSNGHGVCDGYV
eukprot:877647-Prorocentrum_minimum.AAC.3